MGVDLRKDPALLIPAYDDAAGVTAAFNLNILRRLNREAGADFDPASLPPTRRAGTTAESRIEMHLDSRPRPGRCGSPAPDDPRSRRARRIHTENSYKHTVDGFRTLAGEAGWTARWTRTDADGMFSLHLLAA